MHRNRCPAAHFGFAQCAPQDNGSAFNAAAHSDNKARFCKITVSNSAYFANTVEELESPHNYPDNCSDVWTYTVPNAETLYVSFNERTQIEDQFDLLFVYDAGGNTVGKYTGTELAGQTLEIAGDTVRLRLESDNSGNEWGFKVTSVGTLQPDTGTPGDVTGDDDVTIADVVKLNQALLGKVTLTDKEKRLGDVTHDGDITIADVVRLNQFVLGKIASLAP